MQLDHDFEITERLDRFLQLNLAALDVVTRIGEKLGDVAVGHRAVKRSALTRAAARRKLQIAEPFRELLGPLFVLFLADGPRATLIFDLFRGSGAGAIGQPLGQQVVPRIARGDVDVVAAIPEVFDMLSQDDLHRLAPSPT